MESWLDKSDIQFCNIRQHLGKQEEGMDVFFFL